MERSFPFTHTIEEILHEVAERDTGSKELIQKAYAFSEKAHTGHMRLSGEPHLAHLTTTAFYLAQIGMDALAIAAGLLHDTLEDTKTTAADLKEVFGEEISFLVEGVTRLGSFSFYGDEAHVADLRHFFIASAKDIRVILIKLFDRLHNMQTNSFHEPARAKRKAVETMEIYVPIAERLGMGRLRRQLEDLSFPFVDQGPFSRTAELREHQTEKRAGILLQMEKDVREHLIQRGVALLNTEIRLKSLWSLYQKINRKGGDLKLIHDIVAVRVIVSSVGDCYATLGIVHELYRPLPGEFKDYIAFPKPNGYQSIHTTVAAPDGPVEVHIRTRDMHKQAEFGVALNLSHKELADLPAQDVYESKLFFRS
ncbi:bifunctional (p)ppGpp synthetase/guanosine-3',5'-bis(diphosphate) 3'-pyrophosphohydrolase [Candidatus Parcubacteria bacterium]|nr:bifunctional (p)ppGpp synthetase/guanosine-3',5'-bis(diphosphate) 3'-pyrophosphohydrolase [Candidatus Parcubacteria bacterium]